MPTDVRPLGRPTKYDPEFCTTVIDLGSQGKSKAYMAGKLGISRETLNEWSKNIPDFSDAMTQAMLLSQIWWEDKGQSNLTESIFQASMWSRSMAARFPDDWREKQDIDLTGKLQVTEVKRTIVDPQHPDA